MKIAKGIALLAICASGALVALVMLAHINTEKQPVGIDNTTIRVPGGLMHIGVGIYEMGWPCTWYVGRGENGGRFALGGMAVDLVAVTIVLVCLTISSWGLAKKLLLLRKRA
jgi:hypothetical protein